MTQHDDLDTWLAAEHADLPDAADAAFGSVLRAVPLVEPSAEFNDIVAAAWIARTRLQRQRRVARTAALGAAGLLTAAASLLLLPVIGVPLAAIGATVVAGGVRLLAAVVHASTSYWLAAERISTIAAAVIANRAVMATVFTLEVVSLIAAIGLLRLARIRTARDGSMEAWT